MRRKVLFVVESLAGGGAEKVLTTLVQNLDREKFDATLCCITDTGLYAEAVRPYVRYRYILPCHARLPALGKVWYRLKHCLVHRLLPPAWVYRLFVPKGNDVEVAFVEGFATRLMAHSTNRKARKLAWVHTDLENNHWTRRVFASPEAEERAYNRYHRVVCVSGTVREGLLNEFPHLETPSFPLYNPINSHEIKSMSTEPLQTRPRHPLLVTVGRLEPQKGYDRLLRILRNLKAEGLGFEAWILGTGSQEGELRRFIDGNGLQDDIKLLGFHKNPYKYMVRGDLFVCSSRAEGYSTAVTEALILGLPVITTLCSGMDEMLKGGECGLITENSEEALQDGLRRLLKDPALLARYRQKAEERGKDFTLEALMRPIEELLLQ